MADKPVDGLLRANSLLKRFAWLEDALTARCKEPVRFQIVQQQATLHDALIFDDEGIPRYDWYAEPIHFARIWTSSRHVDASIQLLERAPRDILLSVLCAGLTGSVR
jgi:hypothetical protein